MSSWEERMARRHKILADIDEERLYRRNELEWPKEKAEASAAGECQECVEVRQESGRWMVFGVCEETCSHEHHMNDGPGYA